MSSQKIQPSRWVTVRRALVLSFSLGLAATTALLIIAGAQFGGTTGPGTYHLQLGPLTFFTVVREQLAGASTAELRPGFGVFVLTVILPSLAGILAWRRRHHAPKQPGS